ncbi:MAG TPA: hypothetical protein V6C81_01045 [Planktothrix sp.]|jgi:hypothetical protein
MPSPKHSVQGNWRGQYFYSSDPSNGYGFEAVFVEVSGGLIEGNILDDGRLGEAVVGGSFSFPELRFTKIYRGKHAVKYQGTMSEDGKVLIGRWVIPGAQGAGTWRAMRNEEGEDLKFEDIEELEKDKEEARPLVAPMKGNN